MRHLGPGPDGPRSATAFYFAVLATIAIALALTLYMSNRGTPDITSAVGISAPDVRVGMP